MPVYTEPTAWLRAAIESVLQQTEHSLELIIILDNPLHREARRLLHRFAVKDARVQVIENPSNLGRGRSRNVGIDRARGEYIAILDADDIAYPDRLKTEIAYLTKNATVDLVCAGADFMTVDGKNVRQFMPKAAKGAAAQNYFFAEESFIHSTLLVRHRVFDTIRYDPSFTRSQDYEFVTRALQHGFGLAFIEQPVVRYRMNVSDNYDARIDKQRQTLRHATRLFWRHLPVFWHYGAYMRRTMNVTGLLLATHLAPRPILRAYLRRKERIAPKRLPGIKVRKHY
jgi:glycosyltransferase involved in cell wall biosynthesis